LGRFTLVLGTLLIAVFIVPLISALAGGPAFGMERQVSEDVAIVIPPDTDPNVPRGSLDFVDSSVSGGSGGCEAYAVGVPGQYEDSTRFDPTVKQTAYMQCILANNVIFTRKFAGYTISYIYFREPFQILASLDNSNPMVYSGGGYSGPELRLVNFGGDRLIWLKDSNGCIVSSAPKSWANRDISTSCPYPGIPSGISFPVPISNAQFWRLVMGDMYNNWYCNVPTGSSLTSEEAATCGRFATAEEFLLYYYEHGSDYLGPIWTQYGIYVENEKFGYTYTKEKVAASCGGLWLPNYKPFGCEYIRQHYETRFESFSNPPQMDAEMLSTWVWDPKAELLYSYPTDPTGTTVTYTVQEARHAACAQSCSIAGKYGTCIGQIGPRVCQPKWDPPGTVYDDNRVGTWNFRTESYGGTIEIIGPTVTRIHINKWHYVYCGSGWNWVEYGHLCPVGESSPGVIYEAMTAAEWSLVSGYWAELAAADRMADMALFAFYTNQWNGYMTQARLDMFKQYIATGNVNAFAAATCKYCPDKGGDPADYGWTGTYNRLVEQWGVHGDPTGAWIVEPNHWDPEGCGETDHPIWTNQPSLCQMMQWKYGGFYCWTATMRHASGFRADIGPLQPDWTSYLALTKGALCSIDRIECYNPIPPSVRGKSLVNAEAVDLERREAAMSRSDIEYKFYDQNGKSISIYEYGQLAACKSGGCTAERILPAGAKVTEVPAGSHCESNCGTKDAKWVTDTVDRITYSLLDRLRGVTIFDFGGDYCGVTTTNPVKFVCIAPASGYWIPTGRQNALMSIGSSGWLFIDDLWFVYLGCVGVFLAVLIVKRRVKRRGGGWQSAVKHT